MILLSVATLAFTHGAIAQGSVTVILRAPADISQKEQSRLTSLADLDISKGGTVETSTGDLIVRVSKGQTMVVSKDCPLMAPVRLSRELFSLAKKFGTYKPISFRELSPLALYCFRRDLIVQHARYDVGPKSSFMIRPLVDQSVLLGNRKIMNSVGPSTMRTREESEQRSKDLDEVIDSSSLVLARSEEEGKEYVARWPWVRDGSFYGPWGDQRQNIEVERRALEIFQGWFQFEMDKVNEEMFAFFSNDSAWNDAIRGRTAKTTEELQKIAPKDFQRMKDHLSSDYDIYGFSSPEKALDAFYAAKVNYRFSLKLLAGMEGTKERFYFDHPN